MTELLALELVEKKLVTDQIELTIGYDVENLKNEKTLFCIVKKFCFDIK